MVGKGLAVLITIGSAGGICGCAVAVEAGSGLRDTGRLVHEGCHDDVACAVPLERSFKVVVLPTGGVEGVSLRPVGQRVMSHVLHVGRGGEGALGGVCHHDAELLGVTAVIGETKVNTDDGAGGEAGTQQLLSSIDGLANGVAIAGVDKDTRSTR